MLLSKKKGNHLTDSLYIEHIWGRNVSMFLVPFFATIIHCFDFYYIYYNVAAELAALFSVESLHSVLHGTHNLAVLPRISDSPLRDLEVCLRSFSLYQLCCLLLVSCLASTSKRSYNHALPISCDASNQAQTHPTRSNSTHSKWSRKAFL